MAIGTFFLSSYLSFIPLKVGFEVYNDIEEANVITLIDHAIEKYSKDSPAIDIVDITGNGTNVYNLATVATGFQIDWSYIIDIEFPQGDIPPTMLKESEYRLYETTSTTQLSFEELEPGTTETIRMRYAALHTVTRTTSTIPDGDWKAVATLAASEVAATYAAKFMSQRRSELVAGMGNNVERAEMYRSLSKDLLNEYKDYMGIPTGEDAGRQKPYTLTFDIDILGQHGMPPITHRRR